MPRNWLYFFAVAFPLVLRVLILNTDFPAWLWYHHHPGGYMLLAELGVQPLFLKYLGGWPLPVFIVTVFTYWVTEEDSEGIPDQFRMLPIVYVPFSVLGGWLVDWEFRPVDIFIHPLVIVPVGYIYVLAWSIAIWMMGKFRLVV